MEGVVWLRDALIGSERSGVDLSGALHGERLVRPLVVELFDEVVEPGLLLQQVGASRTGGLLLEGEVHALVPAVGVRVR